MENKYLYWALQSVHDQELEIGSKEFESFKVKYKQNYETRELFSDTEILEKYKLNGWRNPLYSSISSLIIGFQDGADLRIKYITGEEKDILQTFHNLLRNNLSGYQLVHFDAEIVLPYIGVRFNKNGFTVSPHNDLKYQGLKTWNLSGVDLKDYYKGAGKYSFSLEDIADIYDVRRDFIHYDSEYTYYHNNQLEALKLSAINKVEVLARVHRKIFNLPDFENVNLIEEAVAKVEIFKPTNWLNELYKEQQFTPEISEGLKKQVFSAKKKLTKKEVEAIFEIIRGAYVITDFETRFPDSKAIITKKETEIRSVIELWK